jgi:hypothetical protein
MKKRQYLYNKNGLIFYQKFTFTGSNHRLDILNRSRGGDLESEGVTCKGLDKELHCKQGYKEEELLSRFSFSLL